MAEYAVICLVLFRSSCRRVFQRSVLLPPFLFSFVRPVIEYFSPASHFRTPCFCTSCFLSFVLSSSISAQSCFRQSGFLSFVLSSSDSA